MFDDIAFLWEHRERPTAVRRTIVVWAKRALTFFSVCRILVRPVLFRLRGARIGKMVILGKAQIHGDVSLLQVGDQTSLGRCEVAMHERVQIGRCVVINDGAVLLTASHDLSDPHWRRTRAPIVIDDYAWIATNAIVLPGICVGRGAVVGAGAVVRADVPPYAVVAGNPATIQTARRAEVLDYSPVLLNAPFEAWVGHSNAISLSRSVK